MTIPELIEHLKSRFTKENLENISVRLIEFFRKKQNFEIQRIYRQAYSSEIHGEFNENPGRVFFALIKTFHPDRLRSYRDRIEEYSQSRDRTNLEGLARLIDVNLESKSAPDQEPSAEEQDYDYDSGEWAHDVDNDFDEFFNSQEEAESESDIKSGDRSKEFLTALIMEEPGLKHEIISESLLAGFEGELDLSGYGIEDLSGLEFCVNLEYLNLENNCIESLDLISHLYRLRRLHLSNNEIIELGSLVGLDSLEELDLSFNPIEDISALFSLPGLKMVNLVGCNPEQSQVNILRERELILIL